MTTINFLFAWMTYVNDNSTLGFHPVYFAIAPDFTIYSNDNWEAFYAYTHCYCEHSATIYCNGFLTADPEQEIREHKSYRYPFIVLADRIKPLRSKDITLYEIESDPEADYFRSITAYQERNTY